MTEELENRKKKLIELFKNNKKWIFYLLLAFVLLFSTYIRTRNIGLMQGKYLPDVDSYIFYRYAEYIAEHGELFQVDSLRYFPVGFDTGNEVFLLAYVIVYIFKFVSFFNPGFTVFNAAVWYPVIFFFLLSVVFYLLVSRLFGKYTGLLATAFLGFSPAFLYRTMAGVSDKEPLGIFFMFLTFYLYVLAIQAEKFKFNILYGVLAGLTTGLMGLSWGGFGFVLLIIPTFVLIKVFLGRLSKGDFFSFFCWSSIYVFMLMFFSDRYGNSIKELFTSSVIYGITAFVLFVSAIYILIRDYNILKLNDKFKDKIPISVLALGCSVILLFVFGSFIFGPSIFFNQAYEVYDALIGHPTGITRFQQTVAENSQPFFSTWRGNFSLPYFLMFFFGSILLFRELFGKLNKYKNLLTLVYAAFISLFIFSKYAPGAFFDGSSNLSKLAFAGSLIGFSIFIFGFYLYLFYKDKESFKEIGNLAKEPIFVFVWFIFIIFGARVAIRLLFVFVPITAILAAYFFYYFYKKYENLGKYILLIPLTVLIVSFIERFFGSIASRVFLMLFVGVLISGLVLFIMELSKLENKFYKIFGIVVGVLLIFSPVSEGSLYGLARSTYGQAGFVGLSFHYQWQNAMEWVKQNTPETAVFAHWWDYGYWIQAMGKRATVTDGGNFYGYWNHLVGRHLLTTNSYQDALEFLYSHNVTNVIMISDEIGKYGAYSSIGGNENNDRASYIPSLVVDQRQMFETRNETVYVYAGGGFGLEEDFVYNNVVYPAGSSGVVAVLLPVLKESQQNGSIGFGQPEVVLQYNGQQTRVPLNCVYFDGNFDGKDNGDLLNFGDKGYNGCFRIIPYIAGQNQINLLGGGLFLSKRVKDTLFAKLYLYGEENENFKLVYDDSSNTPLMFYQGRLLGPIKIWGIKYPEKIEFKKEYLDTKWPDPKLYII